jgi:hypothetical protein
VPLNVEELTKSIIEAQASSGGAKGSLNLTGPALPLEVPATLRDSSTARLDRLGVAKNDGAPFQPRLAACPGCPALASPGGDSCAPIGLQRSDRSSRRALKELALLPESSDRLTSELAIRVKYGIAPISKGLGAPECSRNYELATRITEVLDDSAEGFMALWSDWPAKTSTSRTLEGARRSEDLVALSRRLGKDEFVLQAHHSQWTN